MLRDKKKIISILIALVFMVSASIFMVGSPTVTQANLQNTFTGASPKYVFMFIGDGLSFAQVNCAEIFLGTQYYGDKKIGTRKLSFTDFSVNGVCTIYDAEKFCPDSASTATSLSTGNKTLGGVINMDVTKTVAFKPITERVKEKGYKVGVVTSVSLDHATPAAYYAKVPSRSLMYDIAVQLANSDFDYFAGGGFVQPMGSKGDQPDAIEMAVANGFKYVNTTKEILELNSKSGRVIAVNPTLDSSKALPYEIDRKPGDLALSDFVRKGIDVLNNPNGFFMMVESGKIDWAGHANDAGANIRDVIEFSKAVEEAIQFYNEHPKETLIIVTGDHETGGMTIGWAGTGYDTYFKNICYQTMSYIEFDKIVENYRTKTTKENAKLEDLLPQIKEAFGLVTANDPDAAARGAQMTLTNEEIERLRTALNFTMQPKSERKFSDTDKILYGSYEPFTVTLTHIFNNKQGIGWTSYSHTGVPIPVYALGKGANLFNGYYDNTDIFKKLAAILKVSKY